MEQGVVCGSFDDETKIYEVGSKVLKKEDVLGSKSMPFQTKPHFFTSNSFFSDGQLGFSPLTKSDGFNLLNSHDSCSKVSGARGPFTPSQWLELEHQTLIFKYMTAGIPVPPNFLLPLTKTLNPTLSSFSAGSLRPNLLRWGSFQIGFSGNMDPEPGRCRRTDGKKWRCARDAVPDQKYCERHLNRSRHRSRKPVEGQTGQGTTAADAASSSKVAPPPVTAASQAAPVCRSAAESLANTQPQIKTLQPSADLSSAANFSNRLLINKSNLEDPMHLSSVNVKVEESMVAQKQQLPYNESTRTGFSFASSYPYSQRNSSLQAKKYGLSSDLSTRVAENSGSLGHFIDQWPKIDCLQPERTPFSISVDPIAPIVDFSSSISSVTREKLVFPQLTLAREMNSTPLGLGVGAVDDSFQRQSNWKTSSGGPLAEMLNSTSTTTSSSNEHENCSALNLMTHGWDASSPLGSSPTDVLQRNAFGSMSSSSAGSSPRAEVNKTSSVPLL